MRKVFVGVAVVGLLAGSACGGGGKDKAEPPTTGGPAAATVKAEGTTWSPDEVTLKAGEVLEWNVDGSIVHDLKGDEGVSHKAASKYTVTHKYGKPGTYAFQCTIHPGMTGTVTVNP
ncbi:MAG: hypothetical protein QOI61_780 [Actinomycetota bacterium]|jgi:plastocyanin